MMGKMPVGVSCPRLPVETGDVAISRPALNTKAFCSARLTTTWTGPAGASAGAAGGGAGAGGAGAGAGGSAKAGGGGAELTGSAAASAANGVHRPAQTTCAGTDGRARGGGVAVPSARAARAQKEPSRIIDSARHSIAHAIGRQTERRPGCTPSARSQHSTRGVLFG